MDEGSGVCVGQPRADRTSRERSASGGQPRTRVGSLCVDAARGPHAGRDRGIGTRSASQLAADVRPPLARRGEGTG